MIMCARLKLLSVKDTTTGTLHANVISLRLRQL